MGVSATAYLSFGYVIRDDEDGWLVELTDDSPLHVQLDEYGDPVDDDILYENLEEDNITDLLVKAAGFDEEKPDYPTDWKDEAQVKAWREATSVWLKARQPYLSEVSIRHHGYEYGRHILSTKHHSADWAYEGEIGASQLNVTEEDEAELQDAARTLGIILPGDTRATWWLSASFG